MAKDVHKKKIFPVPAAAGTAFDAGHVNMKVIEWFKSMQQRPGFVAHTEHDRGAVAPGRRTRALAQHQKTGRIGGTVLNTGFQNAQPMQVRQAGLRWLRRSGCAPQSPPRAWCWALQSDPLWENASGATAGTGQRPRHDCRAPGFPAGHTGHRAIFLIRSRICAQMCSGLSANNEGCARRLPLSYSQWAPRRSRPASGPPHRIPHPDSPWVNTPRWRQIY